MTAAGLVATSRAAASTVDGEVTLEGNGFNPEDASISLGSDGKATVRYTNLDDVHHNVHVHHDGNHLVGNAFQPGNSWTITVSDSGGTLTVDDGSKSKSFAASLPVTLNVHCALHDNVKGIEMHGGLTVEP